MPVRMLRPLYTVLWCVALPAVLVRLWWRGRREPGYRQAIGERLGHYRQIAVAPLVWIHAVSLGETNAARPLIARVRSAYPHSTILLTHMTATGRAAGAGLADARTLQAWLPSDIPAFTRAFFAHFHPSIGLVLETEVWPNLFTAAARARVPLFLVNARLSARSAQRYARIAEVVRPAFASLAGVAAQSDADAERLEALGAPTPAVTGNLKFDIDVDARARQLGMTLRERCGRRRPVWLLASTREGEEALVLDAWQRHGDRESLLIIVPRHPQRFDSVATLLATRGIAYARRSAPGAIGSDRSVLLGDSMGEMAAYCAAADVVVVGGSLLPYGGQNLIEPISVGRATVVGPHMFNFADATARALAAGAAVQAHDAVEAVRIVTALLEDAPRRHEMERAALAFHALHQGAADRLWQWLLPALERALGRSA